MKEATKLTGDERTVIMVALLERRDKSFKMLEDAVEKEDIRSAMFWLSESKETEKLYNKLLGKELSYAQIES